MAKEIKPVHGRYPTLVSEGGVLHQKPYKEVGIVPVHFGFRITTNTIPGAAAEQYSGGAQKRIAPNIGKQFDFMVENTRALIEHAKSQGTLEGHGVFYERAHHFASHVSRELGIPHLHASGMVAALSGGGGEWETNKHNVLTLIHHIKNNLPISHTDLVGVEQSRLNNAHQIFKGNNPREVLGDLKEGNFAETIHDPNTKDHVTVDAQMFHGMTGWKRPWRGAGGGTPGLQDPRVYKTMGKIISGVSEEHGLSPGAGQAVAWGANKSVMPRVAGTVPPQHPNFQNYYPISEDKLPAKYRKRSE